MKRPASNLLSLPFQEALTPTSYELPEGITAEQWLDVGRALGRARGSLMWWIGDWWAYGEHAYGDRANAVKSEDWEGPAFGSCVNAATVCRRFETTSRDVVVSFRAHQAIAPVGDDEWRLKVLAWAAKEKPTILAIEARVREVRAQLAQGWTPDQLVRKAEAESGLCVVVNMRNDDSGDRKIDEALINWAEAEGRFVRIDRKTEWGNPFEMPQDGNRPEVVSKFTKFYIPHKSGLLSKISSLRGKVLGCWCHPEECHGHVIADIVNDEALLVDTTAKDIADEIAATDDDMRGLAAPVS
jgi:hypothetical protein